MHLIVGLGNPGPQYARTRHNAGWFVIEELARRHAIDLSRKSFESKNGSGLFGIHQVMLVEPLTFMNLSGRSVNGILRYRNVSMTKLLVIADDLNLPLGKLRLRASGSDGGHNGLKSVAQSLGTTAYARLRFGVGAPTAEERATRGTVDFVLSSFEQDEWPEVEEATRRAADCVECFIAEGVTTAMNRFN